MTQYTIRQTTQYIRDVKKLRKNNEAISRLKKVIKTLMNNPYNQTLRTHLVNIPTLGKVNSSRVTGDIRILWVIDKEDNLVIITLRLQGHDTVYK